MFRGSDLGRNFQSGRSFPLVVLCGVDQSKNAALVLMMLVFVVKVNPLEFIWGLFSGIVGF